MDALSCGTRGASTRSNDSTAPHIVCTRTEATSRLGGGPRDRGRSLPRSGSDGAGIEIARALGHSVTPHLVPALVGLTVAAGCFVRELSGVATETRLEVRAGSGRLRHALTGPTLCTHFGLSGPGPMDTSRYWQLAVLDDPDATLVVSWLPDETPESLDAALRQLGGTSPQRYLARTAAGTARTSVVRACGGRPERGGAHAAARQRRAGARGH